MNMSPLDANLVLKILNNSDGNALGNQDCLFKGSFSKWDRTCSTGDLCMLYFFRKCLSNRLKNNRIFFFFHTLNDGNNTQTGSTVAQLERLPCNTWVLGLNLTKGDILMEFVCSPND